MRALLVIAALLCALPARAARETGLQPVSLPPRWAVGLTLGEPFGLSVKRYLGGANAWDAYAAFVYGPGLRFGGDFIWTLGRIGRNPKLDVDVYAGVGPFIGAFEGWCGPGFARYQCGNGDFYFGGRVPLGVEVLLREAPVSFGLEVAPGIGIAPGFPWLLLDVAFAFRVLL